MSRIDDNHGNGLVIIYRWNVEAAADIAFRDCWRALTLRLREAGGLGSCLTRAADGRFVAIALWPDAQCRAEAFAAIGASPPLDGVHLVDETLLSVTDDLWLRSSFEQ